jgi:two-component system cell cycle response regulator
VGVACSTGAADTPDALLKRADEGVYEAKSRGRNQVIARAA